MLTWNRIYYLPRMVACSILQFRTKTAPFELHSLDGKVAVITGGNSGIGFETAKALALQGCFVYILCRNPSKAKDAMEKINQSCRESSSVGSCCALALDLADLSSVSNCIVELRSLINNDRKRIDYFFCNGGIMAVPYSVSPQGYEIQFATNHLGHFALVGGLIDLLCSFHTRVIILTGDICVWEDDASPDFVYNDDGLNAYCRSKICNQSFGRELVKKYPELFVNVVHPGVVDSSLFSFEEGTIINRIEVVLRPFFMVNCQKGAQTSLYCALTNDENGLPNGSYVHNVFGICDYHPTASNDEWSKKMWDLSVSLCKENNVPIKFN
jgi:NAD(P)-dependent dehydrogenase (short-subunit alcohol dehydrogenase family)